jgi:hypothetical protein
MILRCFVSHLAIVGIVTHGLVSFYSYLAIKLLRV